VVWRRWGHTSAGQGGEGGAAWEGTWHPAYPGV